MPRAAPSLPRPLRERWEASPSIQKPSFGLIISNHLPSNHAYDRFGNRWQQNVTAGTGITQLLTFNGNNQVASNTYDPLGNVTNDGLHTYTYDAENRVLTVSGGTSYAYDAFGRRVSRQITAGTREYTFDLQGNVLSRIIAGSVGLRISRLREGIGERSSRAVGTPGLCTRTGWGARGPTPSWTAVCRRRVRRFRLGMREVARPTVTMTITRAAVVEWGRCELSVGDTALPARASPLDDAGPVGPGGGGSGRSADLEPVCVCGEQPAELHRPHWPETLC